MIPINSFINYTLFPYCQLFRVRVVCVTYNTTSEFKNDLFGLFIDRAVISSNASINQLLMLNSYRLTELLYWRTQNVTCLRNVTQNGICN